MKVRLDAAVADRNSITRSQARSLIMEGRVSVDGIVATKAGQNVAPDARIVVAQPRRFVSRGGEKLERALIDFGIDVRGADALDVGASTGGFTDCLLQHGATQRYRRRRRIRAARLAIAQRPSRSRDGTHEFPAARATTRFRPDST